MTVLKLENQIDIKVFILYLLERIGEPLEFTTINDIVLQDEFVGYFDFALCFSSLLDAGQIEEINTDGKELYKIAESGKHILESYEGELLTVIKERAFKSAMRLLEYKKVKATVTEVDGGYNFRCEIWDKSRLIFSSDYFSTNASEVQRMKENFDDRAEIIYRGAIALLSGDVNFIFDD